VKDYKVKSTIIIYNMEDKENLVDWIDNQFVEFAKRLGLEVQMIDNPKNNNQGNTPVSGTITFLKGVSAKKAAAIMASRRGKTIRDYEGLLLHIPHSSTSFPSESTHSFTDLDEEEKLLIDYYTDELFVPREQKRNICSVVFPYCRLYCDVERLVNDPLEDKGLGISYRRTVDSDYLPFEERSFSRLNEAFKYYADFHADVSKRIVEMTCMNKILLIDCHSFSALPNLLNPTPPDIDICIGYNDDETRPYTKTIDNIVQFFKSLGYKVGINEPFSNSKTFPVPVEYHSVMIEVNKRLYMNEQTLDTIDRFYKLKHDIQSLYNLLLYGQKP
jgi:N-formylglutamate amidohydrolase